MITLDQAIQREWKDLIYNYSDIESIKQNLSSDKERHLFEKYTLEDLVSSRMKYNWALIGTEEIQKIGYRTESLDFFSINSHVIRHKENFFRSLSLTSQKRWDNMEDNERKNLSEIFSSSLSNFWEKIKGNDEKYYEVRRKMSKGCKKRWKNATNEDREKTGSTLQKNYKEWLINLSEEERNKRKETRSKNNYLFWGSKTTEERREITQKGSNSNKLKWEAMNDKERLEESSKFSEINKKMWGKKTEDQRKEHGKKSTESNKKTWASYTEEERAERCRKISEGRIKKSEERRKNLNKN